MLAFCSSKGEFRRHSAKFPPFDEQNADLVQTDVVACSRCLRFIGLRKTPLSDPMNYAYNITSGCYSPLHSDLVPCSLGCKQEMYAT